MTTIFEVETQKFCGRDENDKAINKWVRELRFFDGDLRGVDLQNDDRFKELKTRKQAICRGTLTSTVFPIQYPLITSEGEVLDGYAKVEYEDEGDYNAQI